jgi:hypothetical protein
MYHNAYLADLKILSEIGDAKLGPRLAEQLTTVIPAMQDAADTCSFASGEIALFGDSWLGEAPRTSQLVPTRTAKEADVRVLNDMGYVKLSQGPLEAIVDVGAGGADANPAHAHDDFLSLEAALHGEKVIVDFGVETYEHNDGRQRTRSNANHNGPRVQGYDGLECWHSFRVGRRADRPLWKVARGTDGFHVTGLFKPLDSGSLTVQRTVLADGSSRLVLADKWANVPDGAVPVVSFLLPCSIWRVPEGRQNYMQTRHETGWRLHWDSPSSLTSSTFFPEYGRPSAAFRLDLTPRQDGPTYLSLVVLCPAQTPIAWSDWKDL